MDTSYTFAYSIHVGICLSDWCIDRFKTLDEAKRSARQHSKAHRGCKVSVFDTQAGQCVAMFNSGRMYKDSAVQRLTIGVE